MFLQSVRYYLIYSSLVQRLFHFHHYQQHQLYNTIFHLGLIHREAMNQLQKFVLLQMLNLAKEYLMETVQGE